ncbi:MAG TPA: ABC transporter permease [Thermoleophilia bacterium]|nr:ABC transporter permease [Thermoleophilia bacterium]
MFFTYVFRELRRRHRQALLTALGLAVGVALVVAVTAYADGVGRAQDQVLQSLYGVGTDITVSQQRKMDEGGAQRFGMQPPDDSQAGERFSRSRVMTSPGQQPLSTGKLARIAALDGVGDATGSIAMTVMNVSGEFAQVMQQGGGEGVAAAAGAQPSSGSSQQDQAQMAPIDIVSFSVTGVDTADLELGPLSSAQVASGRSLTSADADARVMLVTKAYARQNSLSVGDTKRIDGRKFAVVGVVALPAGSTSSDLYIPLSWAQKLSDNEGKVNQIYVRADSADDIAAVKEAIEQVLPKATVTTSEDLAGQVSGSLSSASTLADRLGTWLAVAALIAAFAVASLLTVSAVSRRVREFGTLKALGWKGRRIVGQVLGESVAVGVVGAVLGVALGVLGAWLIAAFSPALEATMGNALQGAAQGGPPGMQQAADAIGGAAQSVTVSLTAPVSPQLVGIAVALALAGALIAGAFGGWRASRLRPADALRRVD